MRKALCAGGFALAALLISVHVARAGGERVATQNGDINGDGSLNVVDAVELLRWIFGRTNVPPAKIECDDPVERFEVLGDIVRDNSTALEWRREPAPGFFTFEAAEAFVSALGDGWRLPAIDELLSIVDYARHSPAMPDAFLIDDATHQLFWSSSDAAGRFESWYWAVNFTTGDTVTSCCRNGSNLRVRAVRDLDGKERP